MKHAILILIAAASLATQANAGWFSKSPPTGSQWTLTIEHKYQSMVSFECSRKGNELDCIASNLTNNRIHLERLQFACFKNGVELDSHMIYGTVDPGTKVKPSGTWCKEDFDAAVIRTYR